MTSIHMHTVIFISGHNRHCLEHGMYNLVWQEGLIFSHMPPLLLAPSTLGVD